MGMAASQARLLSITARLTDNENCGQSVSYAKQRLADQTQQITNEYNEALDATKLTVLTGFNGAEANYTDISYSLMTGPQMAESTRHYVVTDTKGRVLVSEQIARAYNACRGNYNQFLAELGYSQADINVQANSTDAVAKNDACIQIHEAWDKYFETVGIDFMIDDEHADPASFRFAWFETIAPGVTDPNADGAYNIGDGYVATPRIARDANGNIIYRQAVDENNQLIYEQKVDGNGNLVFEIDKDEFGNNKYYIAVDDAHNPIYDETVISESNGRYIYKTDSDGNRVYEKKEDGTSDETKPIVYDTTKPVYDFNKPVYDRTKPIYSKYPVLATDENGNIIYDPINYEGTTQESRDLYDYAMALTEAYLRVGSGFGKEYDMSSIKSAADSDNASMLKYYKNIFNKIQSGGCFTYTNELAKVNDKSSAVTYVYTSEGTGTKGNVQKNPLKDNFTFEAALRDGTLRLEYYSTTSKKFEITTIADDTCIQEVPDERAIAKAESKYTQDMADLESKDNKLDLELKKLDTEHTALQTEYDSIKAVVDKNVESSFKIFS